MLAPATPWTASRFCLHDLGTFVTSDRELWMKTQTAAYVLISPGGHREPSKIPES